MKNLKKDNKGFSLVELLVVIAIMVVLVGVIAPTLLNNIEKSREAKDIQSLDAVAAAIQSALADEKAYDAVTVDTVLEVSTLYTAGTTDAFALKVQEYLASQPDMGGKEAKKAEYKMYYIYTSKGQVCVFMAKSAGTGIPADSFADLCTGARGTLYKVVR